MPQLSEPERIRIQIAYQRARAAVSGLSVKTALGFYVQSAPPIFPKRLSAPVPEYLKPGFDEAVRRYGLTED